MNRCALLLLVSAVAITGVIGSAPGAAAMEAGTLAVAAAEETQTCPECGYENKADVNFCIKCGARLQGEAPGGKTYCTQCGAPSPEGSTFCTACGYALKGKKPGLGAASAPPAHKIGIYFTGGLASYGDIELITEIFGPGARQREMDMGRSWAAGGGFILPLWSRPGVVQLSLELSTDAGFSTVYKEFELDLSLGFRRKIGNKTSLIPIRETAIFGVAFGPRKMIKPFCGFGAGVAILAWEFRDVDYEATLDEGTSAKPLFDVPFGCEFHLTPNFALAVKADYLIIPGDIEMEWEYFWIDYIVNASVPDVFLFGGTARFCF